MTPNRSFRALSALACGLLLAIPAACTKIEDQAAVTTQNSDIPKIDFEKYTLPNGLDAELREYFDNELLRRIGIVCLNPKRHAEGPRPKDRNIQKSRSTLSAIKMRNEAYRLSILSAFGENDAAT